MVIYVLSYAMQADRYILREGCSYAHELAYHGEVWLQGSSVGTSITPKLEPAMRVPVPHGATYSVPEDAPRMMLSRSGGIQPPVIWPCINHLLVREDVVEGSPLLRSLHWLPVQTRYLFDLDPAPYDASHDRIFRTALGMQRPVPSMAYPESRTRRDSVRYRALVLPYPYVRLDRSADPPRIVGPARPLRYLEPGTDSPRPWPRTVDMIPEAVERFGGITSGGVRCLARAVGDCLFTSENREHFPGVRLAEVD